MIIMLRFLPPHVKYFKNYGFSERVAKMLAKHGLTSLKDLEQTTDEELSRINRFGPKVFAEVYLVLPNRKKEGTPK